VREREGDRDKEGREKESCVLDLGSAHVYVILITKIEDLRFFFISKIIIKSFFDF
jgi:hypothetical protein